ncbi:MAG: winged helix-turn-helix domain-containing protein [Gammaproteobacteria bacterium]|nr:winged helix-turn-helix domain-containing protein [Gammaproteobacteria bacterium]
MYRFDDFLADPETWRLTRGGQEIHLEPVVLKLLIYLIGNRSRLVTRDELMDTVWGDTVISESALTKAVARLRKALDDDSDAPRYLETVRSKGYRFVAEVEELDGGIVSPSRQTHSFDMRRGMLAGAAAIVVLVAVAVFWPQAPWRDTSQAGVIRSLAVLPMNNLTGGAEQDYYVDGLQDLLITELSQLPGLRVTSRQSTLRYRNSQRPTADIAGELGVDALVEGSLMREGSTIEMTVQLIDGRSDEHVWAERYTRETPRVFDLISDIAYAIGAEIGADASLPEVRERSVNRLDPVDPRAIDAYALGIMHFDRFTREGIRTGIDQFKTAVAIEPEFAMAWGQLGLAYAMQGMFGFVSPTESTEQFRAAELQAIEADPQVALGHSGFGGALFYSWEFDDACESIEEALRLNPSEPYAIHGDSDCLLIEGRFDESVARARELLTISPFSAMHSLPLPGHLYMARRFDEAITAATAMQARVPQYSVHWMLARFFWQQGRFDEALEEQRLEFEQSGDTVLLAALKEGLDIGGPSGAMRAIAEALITRANETYVDPGDIAELYVRAGLVDEALLWVDKAVTNSSYEETWIAFWPHWDPLRDDPRFQDLLVRVYGQRASKIRQITHSIRQHGQ